MLSLVDRREERPQRRDLHYLSPGAILAERKCPVFALFTGNFELKLAVEQQRLRARILEHLFLICQAVTSEVPVVGEAM